MDDVAQAGPAPEHPAAAPEPPAPVRLIQMALASWVSRLVYAAAQLDLADHLAAGPHSAGELAGPLGAHAPSLHRFMRCLASLGLLKEQGGQRFGLSELGEALRSDAPGSARATILTAGSPWFEGAMAEIVHSIKTGATAFEKMQGMPFFDYLGRHPDEAALFSETMIGVHGPETPAVAQAYDFSQFDTIVDVGGATGNLLTTILARHQGPRGILFDRPYVVADAPALLATRGLTERVTIEAGTFFEAVPAGADAYVLSHIIHDWNEEQCLAILGHVHRAMRPGGRLLLIEMVLPDGDAPHLGKMLDMVMLAVPGGQERTSDEYRQLLAQAGFRLTQVIPTASEVSIVEAVQA
ncbi:methyltransferase [Labrys neptuniae]